MEGYLRKIILYKQKAPLKKKKKLRDSWPAIPFYLFSREKFKHVKIRVQLDESFIAKALKNKYI